MNNLLVPVDLSEISTAVAARAACIARSFSSKVWLLHVVLPTHESVPFNLDRDLLRTETAKELHVQRQALHELAEQLRCQDIDVLPYHVPGDVGKTILSELARVKADLVVMGSHQHGNLYHAVFGGVGQKVARRAGCPVMLVSSRDTKPCSFWKRKLFGEEKGIRVQH